MNKKQNAPATQIIAFFAVILTIAFTSCSDSGTGSSKGGGEISSGTDREALDKLIGTWVEVYSNNYYEALEFSVNGYRSYEYYNGEIYDYNEDTKLTITVTDSKVSGKITEVCFEGSCVNVRNKNAVKNSLIAYYQKNYLDDLIGDCKEYPDDYDFSDASKCTKSALKSYKESYCKEYITEYEEDYGIASIEDCTWDKMMAARINTEYESFYERMENSNYTLFSYFYDLNGDSLTTYECHEPVTVNSKQEVLDIIENGNYDNYCKTREYVRKVQ